MIQFAVTLLRRAPTRVTDSNDHIGKNWTSMVNCASAPDVALVEGESEDEEEPGQADKEGANDLKD